MFTRTAFFMMVLCVFSCVALADGGFVLPPPTPEDIKEGIKAAYLDEPEQQAIIVFDGTTETLYLQARYEGNVEDFAWLVPVPSKPTVKKGRKGLMEEIAEYFYQLKLEEWKAGRAGGGGMITLGDEGGSESEKAPKPQKVKVIEARRVGIYDLTVLKASEAGALAEWLNKHKFELPDTREVKEILNHYVQKEMYFCALRVCKGSRKAGRRVSKGWIAPITISFATGRPFYPLRITAVHTRREARTDILIHLFSRPDSLSFRGVKRLARSGFSEHEYRFEEKDLPKCCKAFPGLAKSNYILTSVEGSAKLGEMYGDLWFATQKEELAGPSAEKLWFEVVREDARNDLRAVNRKCGEILADYPCTRWAAKAYERIEKMGKKARELGERDAQERTVEAHGLMSAGRYADAAESFRRISRMYPWCATEAAANLEQVKAEEEDHLAGLWDKTQEGKEKGRKTKDYTEYYKTLVSLMLICKNLRDGGNISNGALRRRYYSAGLAEVRWVDRYYTALMDKKFNVTWKEVEWHARRDPALSYRMCRKIIAVHPDTRYSKKATEFLEKLLK